MDPACNSTFGVVTVKVFGDISSTHKNKLNSAQENVFKALRAIAQKHKEDIVELLGRLDDKYEVEISRSG
jgi:hypothetical protein